MKQIMPCIILCVFIASSCSVKRYIPKGETIYKGYEVNITKNPETKDKEKVLKKKIKLAVKPTRNKFLFGHPYKVWCWYVIGEPKRETGFKAFLRKKLGEPPVFGSDVNPKATAENMESLMTNLGYFFSTVKGDTARAAPYFLKAKYYASIQPQYTLGNVEWVKDSTPLLKLLKRNFSKKGTLKPGDPYTLSQITEERERLDLYLKTKGYYYFNPDYIMAYADSTVGNRKVNLLLNIKKVMPKEAQNQFRINKIIIFPDYSLNAEHFDTSLTNAVLFDGLIIKDAEKKFKPRMFKQTITYRPGGIYDSRTQNSTLNRLINLGPYRFVKNRFEPVFDSSVSHAIDSASIELKRDSVALKSNTDTTGSQHGLNVYYYLTPAKKKSLQAEIDAFTKENNYYGGEGSINWKNRNAFRGGELLSGKIYGGFQTTTIDSAKNSSFKLGVEASLRFPKVVIPFVHIKENYFYPPNTNLTVGYERYVQKLLYSKNYFRFQYDFTWKTSLKTALSFSPVSLSYIKLANVTDSFINQINEQPSLIINVFPETILGTYATYAYNSGYGHRKSKWYFMAGIDLAGNIAGVLTKENGYRKNNIFGVPYAQYAKIDITAHYTHKLPYKLELANRLSIGVGLPYENSKMLPFSKSYTIGGSNSVRGFRSRSFGPGTYTLTTDDQKYFQIIGGDFLLLANTELRIPITSLLSTAFFVDAGNIWTKDTLLFGKEGQISKDFYKQLGVAAGFGIRLDLSILLIRTDFGIPLRKPFLPAGERWISDFNFGSGSWRRDNFIFNIAIGLPF